MADIENNGDAPVVVEATTPVEEVPVAVTAEEVAAEAVTAKEVAATTVAAKVVTDGTPATKLELDIIHQIEYYFGDSNLARDKFLTEEITKENGWVPFTVLLTFKRLASLSEDAAVIAAALTKSEEGLLQISEAGDKVRRHPERPLPEQNEETRKECISRTAYVKGFPLETEMADLIEFFGPFEKVTNIVMRKYLDKPTKTYKFKGSVFVSFATKDQCDEFLKKEKLDFKEKELEKKWQSEYYDSKKEERQNEKNKNKRNDEPVFTLPKGAVIYLEGLGAENTRESIKAAVSELGGEVAFIDYTKGDAKGHVRLSVENTAQTIVDKLTDAKLKVDSVEAIARVLEGDEETEFLKKVVENMKTRRNQGNRFKRGGGGGNNRYHNNRKRHGAPSGDEPSAKRKD